MGSWRIMNNFENWRWHIFFFFKCFSNSFWSKTFCIYVQIIFDIFLILNLSINLMVWFQWQFGWVFISLSIFRNNWAQIFYRAIESNGFLRKIIRLWNILSPSTFDWAHKSSACHKKLLWLGRFKLDWLLFNMENHINIFLVVVFAVYFADVHVRKLLEFAVKAWLIFVI